MTDKAAARQFHVLAIDDDEAVANAYKDCMETAGISCTTADNGWRALELIAQGLQPDVIVSDLRMPGLDGIGFAEELRKLSIKRPVLIFVSGNAQLADSIQAIRLGASDMLLKPIDCGTLVRSIKSSFLGRSQASMASPQVPEIASAPTRAESAVNPALARSTALRKLRVVRHIRGQVLAPELFSDPCWEMMLELYDAYLRGANMTTSTLAEAASIPLTTAIRRLETLAEHKLVNRTHDQTDRRRTLIELSDAGLDALERFFKSYTDL